ncbi:N-lysine methyltransferase KMT5A-A [Notolabrus celidotus]|uniref:N-lysine methyltransferase KMT5A-A n=1 Tax=Notolabrus celidotus TaxID=1203425 RepID=UPI0014908015|nr:N-lysine methyltransferase KMT5A-A [Notolabrus celidotus]
MNGDIFCNTCPITLLNSNKPPVHDENTSKLTQDGRCFQQVDSQRPGEGWRTNTTNFSPKDSQTDLSEMGSQCSPHRLDSRQTHLQPHHLLSSTDLSLPHNNSFPPPPRQTNNSRLLHSHKRSRVRDKVKENRATKKNTRGKNSQNRKVTDFFPIRRSSRKSKTELKCEEKKLIDELITKGIEEGMKVQHIEGKGRGVFATRSFQKGEYVVEYYGDLLQIDDAKKKEAEYAQNPATGCYMYYFQYLCKTYCVDATKESDRLGRLINHSKNGNCQTKLHDINGVPHLILVASRDIDEWEELLYDYGDRSKASIAAHPWLKY